MTKQKGTRITIALECTECTPEGNGHKFSTIHGYTMRKSRKNTPTRLELKKYCSRCRKHVNHKEIKK
uniref:Large ribosomal subunit protein bL33c n=1 Tax=Actinostachys pennula TaxID=148577 RepID=A0A1U7AFL5_9MONI|nr:ribosomal protein L33 [Actinostachys pennula]